MKADKIRPLLVLILAFLTSRALAEEVCFGDQAISLNIDVFDDHSMAVIFSDCNQFVQFPGTVIGKDLVLTAGLPVATMDKTQLRVSVEHSATCPQLPPKGRVFHVKDIYYPPGFVPSMNCTDIAILHMDGDLTEANAKIATLDIDTENNCSSLQGSTVITFKCLEDENGVGGFKPVQTLMKTSEETGCLTLSTPLDEPCAQAGAPVLSKNHKIIGVINYCHANCEAISGATCLYAQREFIGRALKKGESEIDSPITMHEEVNDFIDKCEYDANSPEVINLKKNISESDICPKIKDELFGILDIHAPFHFRDSVLGFGIPALLTWEQCPCK